MDHRFEKMEALLTSIKGKLESNSKVTDTKLETLSTAVCALQKCSSSQQSSIQILQENLLDKFEDANDGKDCCSKSPANRVKHRKNDVDHNAKETEIAEVTPPQKGDDQTS
eukprot:9336075-Ditylum_brightwellii.AAC.1